MLNFCKQSHLNASVPYPDKMPIFTPSGHRCWSEKIHMSYFGLRNRIQWVNAIALAISVNTFSCQGRYVKLEPACCNYFRLRGKKMSEKKALNHAGFIKIGLLLILAVIVLTGFVAIRGLQTFRWGMAECLRWQGESLSERFSVTDETSRQLVTMTGEFARQIESGAISPLKGFTVLRAFYNGPLLLTLLHTSLTQSLHATEMPEGIDTSELAGTSLRFFFAAKQGKIALPAQKEIIDMLMEKRVVETPSALGLAIPEQTESFRKKLSQSTMIDCLKRMGEISSDTAALSPDTILESVSELRQIIAALQ